MKIIFSARTTILAFLITAAACGPRVEPTEMEKTQKQPIDWQGHRGARGLLPENSVPAFLKALEFPVTTLELDVVVSRDSQVVVSHEPWMSAEICSQPGGDLVPKGEKEKYNLFWMDYEEIRTFDCGSRGNPGFPQQEAVGVAKPLLREVVAAVDQYCQEKQRALPAFNIEIKSRPEWDGMFAPAPEAFAALVLAEVYSLGIEGRCCVQSFDERSLRAVKALRPEIVTALLVENYNGVEANLKNLGYLPEIYSPYYRLINANVVDSVHQKGMKLVPWTVNDAEVMRSLLDLGVDGIITDYPNLIAEVDKAEDGH